MKPSKTRAFYIETLVMTLVLLFVISIVLRVFGAAGKESLEARQKTAAALIAQNVVSDFLAEKGELGTAQKAFLEDAQDARAGEEDDTADSQADLSTDALNTENSRRMDREMEDQANQQIGAGAVVGTGFLLTYGEDGLPAEQGDYEASIQIYPEERPAGIMLTMTVSVTRRGGEEVLAAIDTAKYFPDADARYLTDGSDLEMEEMDFETEEVGA